MQYSFLREVNYQIESNLIRVLSFHVINRAVEMWKELQTEMDKLPEARLEERSSF